MPNNSFALDMRGVASSLISQFGDDVVLTKVELGEPNVTSGVQDTTETPYNIKAVIEDYTSAELEYNHIGINDFKATLVFNKDITKADKLNGAQIVNVSKERAQNLDVIWVLQCRQ